MCFIVNVIREQKIINELSFNEKETFLDVRKLVEDENYYMVIMLPSILREKETYYNHFDFIYNGNNIIWNPNIDETIIKNFINTYDIKKLDVYLVPRDTGDVSWCPNPDQKIEIVKKIVSFLCNNREAIGFTADILGIAGAIATCYNFFAKKLKKINQKTTKIKAEKFIYSIIIKDDWKLNEFMKKFEISSKQEAETILFLLGYRYNKKKNSFHITKKTKSYISDNIRTIVIDLENKFSRER